MANENHLELVGPLLDCARDASSLGLRLELRNALNKEDATEQLEEVISKIAPDWSDDKKSLFVDSILNNSEQTLIDGSKFNRLSHITQIWTDYLNASEETEKQKLLCNAVGHMSHFRSEGAEGEEVIDLITNAVKRRGRAYGADWFWAEVAQNGEAVLAEAVIPPENPYTFEGYEFVLADAGRWTAQMKSGGAQLHLSVWADEINIAPHWHAQVWYWKIEGPDGEIAQAEKYSAYWRDAMAWVIARANRLSEGFSDT